MSGNNLFQNDVSVSIFENILISGRKCSGSLNMEFQINLMPDFLFSFSFSLASLAVVENQCNYYFCQKRETKRLK